MLISPFLSFPSHTTMETTHTNTHTTSASAGCREDPKMVSFDEASCPEAVERTKSHK